jgi:transglutaminase-like putative cysteine protease
VTDRKPSVSTPGDGDVSTRTFVLDERIRYCYSAPVTDLCQYLRIVPPAVHGRQRRRDWQLRVEGVATSALRTFSDPWGNLTMVVTVPRVEVAVEFVMHVEVDVETGPTDDGPEWRRPIGVADPRRSVQTRLTAAHDPIRELAREFSTGRGNVLPDAAEICARVHASMIYEWGVTGVHTTASEALAGGRGVCQDYAHIMLAVCRLLGVPARYVSGHLTGEGGSHAWVEVLHPQAGRPGGWAAEGWDPTHNRRTGRDYLVVAVGRDYADAAPLWGTFEGDGVDSTLVVEKRLSA